MNDRKKHILPGVLFTSLGLLLIFLFITPLLRFNVLNIGNILGLLIGFFFIILGLFFSKIVKLIFSALRKKIGKIFLICISAIFIFIFSIFIYSSHLMFSKISTDVYNAQTVIILGCQVIGESPSIMLNERINAGYRYLMENPHAKAILSGGQGNDERISEAECMYRALVNKGIEKDRLIKEEKSSSTYENLIFSKDIIQDKNLSTEVTLITNDFHCYRAVYFADKIGLNAQAYSARTRWYFFPTFYLREICAIIVQCIF